MFSSLETKVHSLFIFGPRKNDLANAEFVIFERDIPGRMKLYNQFNFVLSIQHIYFFEYFELNIEIHMVSFSCKVLLDEVVIVSQKMATIVLLFCIFCDHSSTLSESELKLFISNRQFEKS